MWKIIAQDGDSYTSSPYESREDARREFDRLPAFLKESHMIAFRSGNAWVDRVLTEGLTKNDLEGILLPRMSVDEYVPGDPNTDNIVLAFFIKGVPEAVIPYKNYCEHCNGVLNVDYGDSDTIPNTSIVYVEMDREKINLKDIHEILTGASMLGNFQVDDFTLTFPHTDDKFPYTEKTLQMYFRSRNRERNQMAQRKAEELANQETEKTIQNFQAQTLEEPQDEALTRDQASPEAKPAQPQPDQSGNLGSPGEALDRLGKPDVSNLR